MAATTYVAQLFDENNKPRLTGDRTIRNRVRWVEALSFSLMRPVARTAADAPESDGPRPPILNLNVVMFADTPAAAEIAGPLILGSRFHHGVIEGYRDEQWFVRVSLRNVLVSSSVTVAVGRERPQASIMLGFDELAYEYQKFEGDDQNRLSGDWTANGAGPSR